MWQRDVSMIEKPDLYLYCMLIYWNTKQTIYWIDVFRLIYVLKFKSGVWVGVRSTRSGTYIYIVYGPVGVKYVCFLVLLSVKHTSRYLHTSHCICMCVRMYAYVLCGRVYTYFRYLCICNYINIVKKKLRALKQVNQHTHTQTHKNVNSYEYTNNTT